MYLIIILRTTILSRNTVESNDGKLLYYVITYYHYHHEYQLIFSIKSFTINEDRHVVLSIINNIHTVYVHLLLLNVIRLRLHIQICDSLIWNIASRYLYI